MYKNAAQSYRDNSVLTTSPAKRVALALDLCITSLREAAAAAKEGEIEKRAIANGRARRIVMALEATLDAKQGGEIASNLAQLYSYAQRRLSQVDFANDHEAASEVADLMAPLRDAWQELDRNGHDAGAAAPQANAGNAGPSAPNEVSSLSLST
jgi:flagellar protein FliS